MQGSSNINHFLENFIKNGKPSLIIIIYITVATIYNTHTVKSSLEDQMHSFQQELSAINTQLTTHIEANKLKNEQLLLLIEHQNKDIENLKKSQDKINETLYWHGRYTAELRAKKLK